MAEQRIDKPPEFWSNGSDDVAAVRTADLRAVWNLTRNAEATSEGVLASVCTPGADVKAVWFRAAMLEMVSQRLSSRIHDGDFDDTVFERNFQ